MLAPVSAWAQAPIVIPAPPGTAEAVALEVEGVVAVARTEAEANQDSGRATANPLELGDSALVGETQNGVGIAEGNLLDTGDIGIGRIAIAPFKAQVERLTDERRATAEAALLRLVLLNPDTLTLDVLQSFSQARHSNGQSSGNASSDGAVVTLLGADGIRLVLLHSDGDSLNGASSYVLGLNDTQLITDEDIGNTTQVLDLPGLLTLGLVDVNGGAGSGLVDATNVALNVLDDTVKGTVSGVAASGTPLNASAAPPSELGAGDNGGGGGGGGLPRTGASILLTLALGLGLVGAGSAVYKSSRRRSFGV